MEKKELIGLSKEELTAELVNIGEKAFRAKQLWQWIYFRGETDFDKMTNISKDLRENSNNIFDKPPENHYRANLNRQDPQMAAGIFRRPAD